MAEILRQIVEAKKIEVERLKIDVPVADLEQLIKNNESPLNFAGNLWGDVLRVIAEVKRASPAKGVLRADLDPVDLTNTYIDNGAAAISVLTNTDHFKGSIKDLQIVQEIAYAKSVPVLRKEFIFDPYQVYESRAYKADAILLIVSMLPHDLFKDLLILSQELWMQCLVEVHNESELTMALELDSEIIGINNRDLKTFKTDVSVTERLAPMIPKGKIIVSESGVSNSETINRVRAAGANAVLVGEALVTSKNPGVTLRELL